MGPWSRLYRDDPDQVEVELAKRGTTLHDLATDVRDVPELKHVTERLSEEGLRRLALEWFGDQGHRQPEQRTDWVYGVVVAGRPAMTRKTPDFGSLGRLDDDASSADLETIASEPTRGARSRWRRADLETIFVKHAESTPRAIVASGDLVEPVHFQRIYELRGRGDVGVEKGRLRLPPGTTGEAGWVILPRLD